jgi:hypothetical protein
MSAVTNYDHETSSPPREQGSGQPNQTDGQLDHYPAAGIPAQVAPPLCRNWPRRQNSMDEDDCEMDKQK